jgi:hypothetical protein
MGSQSSYVSDILDLTALAALAARSQATTHAHTSRGLEPLTAP